MNLERLQHELETRVVNSQKKVILTPHQQEKFDEVISLLRKGNKRINLIGSAGVGKTVLASELVKFVCKDMTINPNYNNGEVYVTAPTNKAMAILQGKIQAKVEFKSIHSALKLSRYVDRKSGQVTFVPPKKSWGKYKNPFEQAKFCILDESSMLNSDFIGGNERTLVPYLKDFTFPILFIGDDKQLNPVGEPNSPVFHQGYPTVELTEIIRQGEGNPIISLSRDLDLLRFKKPHLIDGKGYTYSNHLPSIIDNLAEVNGTDELKYIAYTNDKGFGNVDSINELVRIKRYGNPKRIEKEETIVFNSPYGSFYTSKELKVEKMEIITSDISVPRETTKFEQGSPSNEVDYIKLKFYRVNDSINIIHEDSDAMFKLVASVLTENCKRHGWNWQGKYFFEEQFADIKYNHAITVHKSQGSTYKQTILNIGNIDFNKDASSKQRMLYTAVTRASDLVILNNM